jgi:hypothetical protein
MHDTRERGRWRRLRRPLHKRASRRIVVDRVGKIGLCLNERFECALDGVVVHPVITIRESLCVANAFDEPERERNRERFVESVRDVRKPTLRSFSAHMCARRSRL